MRSTMVRRWRFSASFVRPVFPASRMHHISDLHSKFTLGHTMCGSMVDIQSAAAEIRQRIKKEDRKKPQGKHIIMSTSAKQGGHKILNTNLRTSSLVQLQVSVISTVVSNLVTLGK